MTQLVLETIGSSLENTSQETRVVARQWGTVSVTEHLRHILTPLTWHLTRYHQIRLRHHHRSLLTCVTCKSKFFHLTIRQCLGQGGRHKGGVNGQIELIKGLIKSSRTRLTVTGQRGADSDGKMVNRNAWRRVEDKETQFVTELPGASDPESIFKTDLEFNTWYLDWSWASMRNLTPIYEYYRGRGRTCGWGSKL